MTTRSATSRSSTVLPWVSTVARIGLAAVFLTAGLLKAVDPQSSVAAVRAYELLSAGAATLVGWGLPFVELALGVLLLLGVATRAVTLAAAVLLVVFIAGVLSAAARGLSIDCGCFGGGGAVAPDQTAYAAEIARDAGLVVIVTRLRSLVTFRRRPGTHLAAFSSVVIEPRYPSLVGLAMHAPERRQTQRNFEDTPLAGWLVWRPLSRWSLDEWRGR